MDRTHYTQLTLEERYHVQIMRKQGKSLRSIAIGMGRSHSTLSRELRRNQGGRGYRHKQADRLAFQCHRNKAKAKKLTQEAQDYIQEKIRLRWSLEQVCGRLLTKRNFSLSPETVIFSKINSVVVTCRASFGTETNLIVKTKRSETSEEKSLTGSTSQSVRRLWGVEPCLAIGKPI